MSSMQLYVELMSFVTVTIKFYVMNICPSQRETYLDDGVILKLTHLSQGAYSKAENEVSDTIVCVCVWVCVCVCVFYLHFN